MDVGDRRVLKASNRMFKVIAERIDGFMYWETIKFYDDGSELEIKHTELNPACRPPTSKEEELMNKLEEKR